MKYQITIEFLIKDLSIIRIKSIKSGLWAREGFGIRYRIAIMSFV
jgi:hypothetical protein